MTAPIEFLRSIAADYFAQNPIENVTIAPTGIDLESLECFPEDDSIFNHSGGTINLRFLCDWEASGFSGSAKMTIRVQVEKQNDGSLQLTASYQPIHVMKISTPPFFSISVGDWTIAYTSDFKWVSPFVPNSYVVSTESLYFLCRLG